MAATLLRVREVASKRVWSPELPACLKQRPRVLDLGDGSAPRSLGVCVPGKELLRGIRVVFVNGFQVRERHWLHC